MYGVYVPGYDSESQTHRHSGIPRTGDRLWGQTAQGVLLGSPSTPVTTRRLTRSGCVWVYRKGQLPQSFNSLKS